MVFLQDCCSWVSLLELGRPREGRTVVGRESQKKKEGAGSRGVSGRPARSWLAGVVEAAVKEKKKGKPAGREERKMASGGEKKNQNCFNPFLGPPIKIKIYSRKKLEK